MLKRKSPTHIRKIIKCKPAVISVLRNNLKKDLKNIQKSVAEAEKGSTFAPATAKNALRHSGSLIIFEERDFRKKRLKKACGKGKSFLHLHPAKHGKFLEILAEKIGEMRRKESFKNFSSFSCEKQKEVLVLHPL